MVVPIAMWFNRPSAAERLLDALRAQRAEAREERAELMSVMDAQQARTLALMQTLVTSVMDQSSTFRSYLEKVQSFGEPTIRTMGDAVEATREREALAAIAKKHGTPLPAVMADYQSDLLRDFDTLKRELTA